MIHNMDCECNCIAPSVDMDNRTYSDHGNICYIVDSNNIIIGVTWIDNIRNPLIE